MRKLMATHTWSTGAGGRWRHLLVSETPVEDHDTIDSVRSPDVDGLCVRQHGKVWLQVEVENNNNPGVLTFPEAAILNTFEHEC